MYIDKNLATPSQQKIPKFPRTGFRQVCRRGPLFSWAFCVGHGMFDLRVTDHFRQRHRAISECGAASFWDAVPHHFGTWNSVNLVPGTASFWGAVPHHFGTRYRTILVPGTASFWGAVPYHFWVRYRIIFGWGTHTYQNPK